MIPHTLLIKKLQHYCIRGTDLDWFIGSLANRKQYVHNNGVNSEFLPIKCEVPQGSILEPLLFIVYIKDSKFIEANKVYNVC